MENKGCIFDPRRINTGYHTTTSVLYFVLCNPQALSWCLLLEVLVNWNEMGFAFNTNLLVNATISPKIS